MKKIIRLTESDLTRIVRRVINEQSGCPNCDTIIKHLEIIGKPQYPNQNNSNNYKNFFKSLRSQISYITELDGSDKNLLYSTIDKILSYPDDYQINQFLPKVKEHIRDISNVLSKLPTDQFETFVERISSRIEPSDLPNIEYDAIVRAFEIDFKQSGEKYKSGFENFQDWFDNGFTPQIRNAISKMIPPSQNQDYILDKILDKFLLKFKSNQVIYNFWN